MTGKHVLVEILDVRLLEAQISAEMLEVCQRTGESQGFMAFLALPHCTGTTPTTGRLGLVQLTELSQSVLILWRENQTKIKKPSLPLPSSPQSGCWTSSDLRTQDGALCSEMIPFIFNSCDEHCNLSQEKYDILQR